MAELVVPGCWRVGFGFMNAYVVDTGADQLTVIDAASPWLGQSQRIVRAATAAGYAARDIGDILITHQHIDHAGGVAALAAATGARVHIHQLDAPELEAGARPRNGVGRNWFTNVMARTSNLFPLPAATVDHRPIHDEILPMGLIAIHTPGHTDGHLAFLWPAHGGVLFVGDALANWGGSLGLAPVAADWAEVEASAHKLAALDFEIAVFGHGRVLHGGAAAAFRRYLDAPRSQP